MSLIERLKNIHKKNEGTKNKQKKIPIVKSKCKYENMVLISPYTSAYEGNENYFVVKAYDKNNNPISNETIKFKVAGEIHEIITDETGKAQWLIDLPRKKHDVQVQYPNGEYPQVLKTTIHVKKKSRKPKSKKRGKRSVVLSTPNMKMYINSIGEYYVRLKDRFSNPLVGEEITVTINDEPHVVITDEGGFARVDVGDLKAGRYEVLTEFKGNSEYDPREKKSELIMAVRDIDKEVIIDVDHLSMEFKVSKDKIDTLKEFIIRTLKRNKKEHEKIRVLDDISFKVYKGDRLGILGFNGAGKSTLLKIMTGIYEPTSGKIKTYGNIAPLLELGAGFDKNYTGKNNIFLNASLLSIDENFIKEKYDDIVEFSELGEFINYPIKNYSSGMRTKLGFSIATLINPDILIIDEILSVGDIKFKKKSAGKINSMMKDGVTVLLVSHSIGQIRKICDRCIWLENGQIKMDGEADDVCDAYLQGARKDIKNRNKNKNGF